MSSVVEETAVPVETAHERLIRRHKEICAEAYRLMRKKNADYSTPKDPFANFERHGALGFLVRMDDKLARLNTFVRRGSLEVVGEGDGWRDILVDLINYSVLFVVYTEEREGKNG